MKIFEKFIQMPLKVKLASIFLVLLSLSMSLLILYTLPWLILGIAFGLCTFFALVAVFEYFGWFK
jgi:hypothetical protein